MPDRRYITGIFLLCFVIFLISPCLAQHKPRLIVQITVDQLRGELPGKYIYQYKDGGFKYLLDSGIVYANAHYDHSNTETAVGHTALATGTYPSVNGMVSNDWYDARTGKNVYAVEDEHSPILLNSEGNERANNIPPDQDPTAGRSPKNIASSTFSDELAFYTAGKAKIFGISVKDRAAITLAGHAGKAFWFDDMTGDFVTSNYYYSKYPDWVVAWNKKRFPDNYKGKSWELMYNKSNYLYGDKDNQSFEVAIPGFGRTFPHPYGDGTNHDFYRLLTVSPAGDEILLDFAKTLIDNEDLGEDTIPDYLSISFSCTDYIDHIFSPSSLEAEDNILRLDRTLADLFKYIDQKIGLNNTLIVLSADHGASEAPELAKSFGIDAGRLVMNDFFDKINADLKSKFGAGRELISSCMPPYIYLNHNLIREKKINEDDLSQFLVSNLMKLDGIALAVTTKQVMNNTSPDEAMIKLIRNNYYYGRSGDIYIVPKPYWLISDDLAERKSVASSHGSPWDYDTFVPVIFAGYNLKGEHIYRKIYTTDIAPTLSAVVGSKYPSGTRGIVLKEVVGNW